MERFKVADVLSESLETAYEECSKKEEHFQKLLQKADEFSLGLFNKRNVPYDGDCLFHSIGQASIALRPGLASDSQVLRCSLVNFIKSKVSWIEYYCALRLNLGSEQSVVICVHVARRRCS